VLTRLQPGTAAGDPQLQAPGASASSQPETLPETEKRLLLEALEKNRWNVTRAARQLGVSRDTLRYRMEKFRLKLND